MCIPVANHSYKLQYFLQEHDQSQVIHETLKFEIPFYSLFPMHSKQPNRGYQKYETHARLNNHKQNDQSPKR